MTTDTIETNVTNAIKNALAKGHTEWAQLFCEKELGHVEKDNACTICGMNPIMVTIICDRCGCDLGCTEAEDFPPEMRDGNTVYARCPMGSHNYA